MKQYKFYLASIVLILLSVSCRVNKCLQQSDKNITFDLSKREAFVLNITAELLNGDWCAVEMKKPQEREKTSYTRYSIRNNLNTSISILIFSTNEQAIEYLQEYCNETSRYHNLLACIETNQSTYDSYTKHYDKDSSIAWVYNNHYFIVSNNYLGTYSIDIPSPSTESELLYLFSILTGLLPLYTNEIFHFILIIFCPVIIYLLIKIIIISHKKRNP
jgi:hypothetical protein